jgi:hypothetical protein
MLDFITSTKAAGSSKPRWAHVRRRFYDIHVAHGSAIAGEAIQRIGKLYDIEREMRGQTADLRCEIRQARARTLMDDLQRWLHKNLAGLSRKSDTAAAIRYALSRWRALGRYLDDGAIEIDNSAAERALRVVALGRENPLAASMDRYIPRSIKQPGEVADYVLAHRMCNTLRVSMNRDGIKKLMDGEAVTKYELWSHMFKRD